MAGRTRDLTGKLLCTGIAALVGFQALHNVRLSLSTSLKWYCSKIYLGGLLKKLKRHLLAAVTCLLPLKSQRKRFREKYLAKKNHFN